jgi:hypothetical protein
VIPLIDPSATSLQDILEANVNCQAVGQYVYEAIGFGSAGTFESACRSGLSAGSRALYKLMEDLDGSALEFGIAGTARAVDRNGDSKMDELTTGVWSGTLGYAGTPAPLGTAKFFGKSK